MLAVLFRRPKDSGDRLSQLVPFGGFHIELFTAFRRQAVIFRPAIVLRGSVLHGDPPPLDQPVQGRVERSLLHLKHLRGVSFDGLCYSMAMYWSQQQCSKNQQVKSAL